MDIGNITCAAQSVGPANQLLAVLLQSLFATYCSISSPEKWPSDFGEKAVKDGLMDYDFIVVGAGTAGSIVATRLSENPNNNVLLLEAGGDPPIESEIPDGRMQMLRGDYDWQYRAEPNGKACLGIQNKSCLWPRGKVIGGSDAINGMIYVRGNRKDYDTWKELGNPTWGWDNVINYFKKAEGVSGVNPGLVHGNAGPLSLERFSGEMETKEKILKAAEELGYKKIDAFDDGNDIGFGLAYGNVKDGKRSTTAKAYLANAQKRQNLHVIKHATVTKVNFNENKVAKSVTFTYKDSKQMTVKATKEIILSAGAVDTPKLLMLSGVGPSDHLKKFNIPVIADLPVGENLQDHPVLAILFTADKAQFPKNTERQSFDNLYNYLTRNEGPLANVGLSDVVGFVNTVDSKSLYPDIQYQGMMFRHDSPDIRNHFGTIGYTEEIVQSLEKSNKDHAYLAANIILLNPKSKGNIKLRSAAVDAKPIITANYLEDEEDLATFVRSLQIYSKFESTKVYQEFKSKVYRVDLPECNNKEFKSDDYWRCYVRHMLTTLYHPVGTTKMGPDSDPEAVVTPELLVRKVKGLRVCDAGIMPLQVSGNTNGPVIMIGEKCSDLVKKHWQIRDEL